MDDGGAAIEENNTMGAANNSNAARLAALQERKKQIEETLAKRNQELRQLCIQEAELTGITPPEMPLEPGETLPQIRRRVGTAYQLNEALVKNASKDKEIADLQLQIQLHNNLAEAALGLANDQNMSKTVKRQHRTEYQKHRAEVQALTQKLNQLKEKAVVAEQQIKQKKKPRVPDAQDDNISVNTLSEPFPKSDLRNSLRYSKHSNENIDARYVPSATRQIYRNSETVYLSDEYYKHDEFLPSGLYRLSLNGYSRYMERRENVNSVPYPHPSYNVPYNHIPQYNLSPHYQKLSPQMSPQMSQHSLQMQHSPQLRSPHKSSPNVHSYQTIGQEYKYNLLQREPSPTVSNQMKYYANYENAYRNPHQLQPHQQYEHNGMTQGLGGCWRRTENGGMVWCMSNTIDSSWQRDKRFGSLDRRKNKRVNKRVSPVDSKSATLATVPSYPEQVRTASIKSSQTVNRRCQDHRYLVRTQSLGSVGVQTVDSVYQSDDNSSEGDNRSISDRHSRKHKEKEWTETSLDGPLSPPPPPAARLPSAVPTVLAPEEKYVMHSPPPQPSPQPKPPLEIPAETSPRPPPDAAVELFNNNNVPKNCTVVQAGRCKPYREETKPFEMSDFYKYSTKFKKSPAKGDGAAPGYLGAPKYRNSVDSSGNLEVNHTQVTEMNAWYNDHERQIDNGNTNGPVKNRSTATLV